MKKNQPEDDEASIVMHALRSVTPRLVTDDVPVYLGLIADMFPQQRLPKASDSHMKAALEKVLQEQHLQAIPSFVEKGMELYETQLLRHGLLVVSGKKLATRIEFLHRILEFCRQAFES